MAAMPAKTRAGYSLQTGIRIAVLESGFSGSEVSGSLPGIKKRLNLLRRVMNPTRAVQKPMDIQAKSSVNTMTRIVSCHTVPL